jgi:hypothetical protein
MTAASTHVKFQARIAGTANPVLCASHCIRTTAKTSGTAAQSSILLIREACISHPARARLELPIIPPAAAVSQPACSDPRTHVLLFPLTPQGCIVTKASAYAVSPLDATVLCSHVSESALHDLGVSLLPVME